MKCTGLGECLQQDYNGEYSDSECCGPIKCPNYEFCETKCPQWLLYANYGMCINCAVRFGRHEKTGINKECQVCFKEKEMIKICCGCEIINLTPLHTKYFKDDEGYISEQYKESGNCPFCGTESSWI